jgi:hypothetical protein
MGEILVSAILSGLREGVATLALGSRPKQGLGRLRAKRKLGSEGKCEGMNLHTPKRASTSRVWSPGEFLKL